ncbi:putative adaptor protein complex, sigma subunit [Dioscorea sansibarensis]
MLLGNFVLLVMHEFNLIIIALYHQLHCILQNKLVILEFIHLLVETMDRHFGNVCELGIMFHLEKAHFMLEEMVINGCVVETNKQNILTPIQLMNKTS